MDSKLKSAIEKKANMQIRRYVCVEDIYVCCFETYGRDDISDDEAMRNVIAFDKNGNELWRIEDIRITDKLPESAGAGYTNVFLDKQGALILWGKTIELTQKQDKYSNIVGRNN